MEKFVYFKVDNEVVFEQRSHSEPAGVSKQKWVNPCVMIFLVWPIGVKAKVQGGRRYQPRRPGFKQRLKESSRVVLLNGWPSGQQHQLPGYH